MKFIADINVTEPYIFSVFAVLEEAKVGVNPAPVHVILLQLPVPEFMVTVLLVLVKELASKNTSFPGPGMQLPAAPPLLKDQCVGSFQLPVPPIQYMAGPENVGNIQLVLFPASKLFVALAVYVAESVALMSCIMVWSTFRLPFTLFIVAWLPLVVDLNAIGCVQVPVALSVPVALIVCVAFDWNK